MSAPRLVLGIETSCDETAVAVVRDGTSLVSSVVSSQVDLHAAYGGVVPELAGRAHLAAIGPVLHEALERAGLDRHGRSPEGSIDAIACTVGPGLIGSLLVGVSSAKSLALGWGLPFIGVNHLEGHLYGALLEDPEIALPAAVLIVSGGHSLIVEMHGPGMYRVLGQTLDDAAGEAFDKIARFLDLGYPGGPAIEKAARDGDPDSVAFPRALLHDGLDLSFSGLKTAVLHYVKAHPEASSADIAASFQAAIVDVLVDKLGDAAAKIGAKSLCLAGGVAANTALREATAEAGARAGYQVFVPSKSMCTDNAAMIAAAGYFRLLAEGPSPMSIGAEPSLAFPERAPFPL
jgi:N6-L-threonylcarbamoyladenine synthase